MKHAISMGVLALGFAAVWLSGTRATPAKELSFRVVFGLKRQAPIDYSGSVTLSEGKVVRVEPWRFFGEDGIEEGARWKLTIKTAAFENQPDKPTQGGVKNTVPAGMVVTAEAPPSAVVRIATAQGGIEFRLHEVDSGRALQFRDGDVSVERTPTVQRVSPRGGEHDYPSVAVTRKGVLWAAWQAYEGGSDSVYVRRDWSEPFRLAAKADVYRTAVAEDAKGRIWAVWAERAGEDWDLYARTYDGRAWSSRRKLTSADSPNISHRLAVDPIRRGAHGVDRAPGRRVARVLEQAGRRRVERSARGQRRGGVGAADSIRFQGRRLHRLGQLPDGQLRYFPAAGRAGWRHASGGAGDALGGLSGARQHRGRQTGPHLAGVGRVRCELGQGFLEQGSETARGRVVHPPEAAYRRVCKRCLEAARGGHPPCGARAARPLHSASAGRLRPCRPHLGGGSGEDRGRHEPRR